MAVPRKGFRNLVVDGEEYRWRVTHEEPDYHGSVGDPVTRCVIVSHPNSGALLKILTLPSPKTPHYLPERQVKPGEIANCIRQARDNGWNLVNSLAPFLWTEQVTQN